ncbi:MAG: addiction module protein [Luteolibacter sp.]
MIALEELTKLSIAEREEIIAVLEQSLVDDGYGDFRESPELIAELKKRDAEYEANPEAALPWDEVKKQILSRRG